MPFAAVVAVWMVSTASAASQSWPLPQPAPMPPPIEAPRDTPFPGTIRLHVDATDTARGLFRATETLPVVPGRRLTLFFPQWLPGDHGPTGQLDGLAGLKVQAGKRVIAWTRDAVQVAAFHIDIPTGVTSIDVHYQFLGATESRVGPVLTTSTMLDLQWHNLVLYPSGHYARHITYAASVKLPAGWEFASPLTVAQRDGDGIQFEPVTLDTLVDSPVIAGRSFKRILLSATPVPVHVNIVADDASGLEPPPEFVRGYQQLVQQASRLFGSHHYDHYDLMLWLADGFGPSYFEHLRAGENALPADFFTTWKDRPERRGHLAHGFVHSWNGLFRRPAEMWTPNFNTPERDSLLWVFEGLTSYWQDVLTTRAGLWSREDALEDLAGTVAAMVSRPGRRWRPLRDVTNDAIVQRRKALSWKGWQRDMFDAYSEGELIWLEADTLIRERSGGRKSLDDFARAFFGVRPGSQITMTYTLEDIVAALNAVEPHDWSGFFRSRIEDTRDDAPLAGITRGGYRLVWSEEPTDAVRRAEAVSGNVDLSYSLGMTVAKDGKVLRVDWEGPAFDAGLLPGAVVTAVNGLPHDSQRLKDAVRATARQEPLRLSWRQGSATRSALIPWQQGLRYPRLRRVEGTPARLDAILKPRE
ncbi:M61 family metallopeptidase [Corallococcus carmarthensis]|uniref:M61 family metallopeptidase n=1 Tax=Corallococcus carmarthensis TaxID=2316728 RepID=UPI00148C79C3|nr:M61 family metallopeptidase [Corallococcus carmarthensis]NOK18171.1 M61 family metallopeptidase [Corallococcus carmarthensis]